jgi:hypothetical protein
LDGALDETKTPRAFDMRFVDTAGEKTSLGIYELKGNSLKTSTAPPGQSRPTQFASPSGSTLSVKTYRRLLLESKTVRPW